MRYLLPLLTLLVLALPLSAQRGEQPAPARGPSNWWYGGNFSLNFSGDGFTNVFQVGVAPMAGYKFTPILSFGPRISVAYSHITTRLGANEKRSYNPISWSAGVFSRLKVYNPFFAHVEYSYESEPYSFDFDGNLLRRDRGNIYLGAGFNQTGGSGLGYEILLLYNASLPDNQRYTLESPLDIRFGFTYNF